LPQRQRGTNTPYQGFITWAQCNETVYGRNLAMSAIT
jgi:hypothetical protein